MNTFNLTTTLWGKYYYYLYFTIGPREALLGLGPVTIGFYDLQSDPLDSVSSHLATGHFPQLCSAAFDNFQFHLLCFVFLIVLIGIS